MAECVVNSDVLLNSLGNDAELMHQIVDLFLIECPEMLKAIRSGIEAQDSRAIMRASHSLKGAVSVFGSKAAVEAAQHLEYLGREQQLREAPEAFLTLEREISIVMSALAAIASGSLVKKI